MDAVNPHWYVMNESRQFPLSDDASGLGDDGVRLPTDVLADLHIRFPRTAAKWAYLSSLSVTAGLVSLTIVGSTTAPSPADCEVDDESIDYAEILPLASLWLPKPIVLYRPYPLKALAGGVGGWVVFGEGVRRPDDYSGRFSSPSQAFLVDKAAKPYSIRQVESLRPLGHYRPLTGVVQLQGGDVMEVVTGVRRIEGADRRAIILRIREDQTDVDLEDLAGECGRRPESDNCLRTPLERINNVGPDCDGEITIQFGGCVSLRQASPVCGAVVSCNQSMDDVCGPPRGADDDGNLPNDYDDECVVITAEEGPMEDIVHPIETPGPTLFRTSGGWEQKGITTRLTSENAWSIFEVPADYAVRGRRFTVACAARNGKSSHNAGLALSLSFAGPEQTPTFLWAGVDWDRQRLCLLRQMETGLLPLASVPVSTKLSLNAFYRLEVVVDNTPSPEAMTTVRLIHTESERTVASMTELVSWREDSGRVAVAARNAISDFWEFQWEVPS